MENNLKISSREINFQLFFAPSNKLSLKAELCEEGDIVLFFKGV